MATNYPVGDFLIRIKNAMMANKKEVVLPQSKFIVAVAKVLKREGFLSEVKEDRKGTLVVRLAYHKKQPVLVDLKLVSKPGLRIYVGKDELERRRGAAILILSTPKGIMSSTDALKKGVGGEVIAEIK